MSFDIVIVIIFISVSCWWVYSIHPKLKFVLLHLVLLLSTPWLLILSLSQPSLRSLPANQPRLARIAANANFFSSPEFLFFSGDRRPSYGIAGFGMFLPSFLPLIALGLLTAVKQKGDRKYIFPVWWLIGGLAISIATSNHPTLPGALWFLPSLSLLATFGLYWFIDLVKNNPHPVAKSVSFVVLAWLVYEIARLYYILLSWQVFTI